ncbi:MAG TPA: serine hydrolase domain-containing protein [Acidimicrobiales bacterium]|nr:serine hydrolase domain-containing protein [Acidimicrobiales bacterium]
MSSPLDAVADWPVTAAVAVVGPDGTRRRGDPFVPRPWASVTKLLVALSALVAVEEGSLDLDTPAGPPGSTVRHLLAHASGLGLDGDEARAAPGARRIYSNRGIELAAGALEAATGFAFADYLAGAVLEPLGMAGTRLEGSPAWGGRGPLTDLLALAAELRSPTLVDPATLAAATAPAFAGIGGVLPGFGHQAHNDWGLGFEVRDHKSPHWTGARCSPATFGHFGQSGAFLWVDPAVGVACCGVADTAFGPWAAAAWPALSDSVLAAYTDRR